MGMDQRIPEGILLERSLKSLFACPVIPCHSCRNCDKVQLTAACAYGGANRRDQEWAGDPKVHNKHQQAPLINGVNEQEDLKSINLVVLDGGQCKQVGTFFGHFKFPGPFCF